ncbi:cystathionine gamma-synthase [Pseudobacteriovorax antillogorgiicola]|uniref:Cystathionine beta-lyase n=1 Tax=Pseudobacteriovorax antillogorgiicola TaxID=1513793 RepID=A0A1Y6CUY1_9BACT|nr:cystathionine gamma-synthase [Pseudobacteriovorax antillogorgiicola]TCS44432.1 cystathionine beta-lyase [Pseudobacteriovorax antillogorgiicola]SMF78954.1 cystathionine beta-lyase [Pseudobacteriovorax antillogorgiicola]
MAINHSDFTKVVHAGVEPEPRTGAIMTPIFQTSTYVQQAPGEHTGWDYSRAGNPTRDALEASFAALEGAKHGLAFSSGLAAEQAIIQILDPGDEVIVCDDVYGGTGRLFRTLYAKYNLKFHFVDMTDIDAVKKVSNSKTKMLWVETPTNPLLKVIDIRKMSHLAKELGALLVVDNTFSSPIFQSPLEFGADIVMHSTTKYIGGHSDIIGGAVMTSDDELHEKIKYVQFAAGAVPGPFEAFLLLRSIKTLAVRMEQHQKNAMAIAKFLEGHSKVESVFYPGLESHSHHEIAREQMKGFSGMVSFNLKGTYDDVVSFLQRLNVFELAESLGGVESLVNHPEKMTHASVPEPLRKELGIGPNLLRLSVGIESADDLIADLDQALNG